MGATQLTIDHLATAEPAMTTASSGRFHLYIYPNIDQREEIEPLRFEDAAAAFAAAREYVANLAHPSPGAHVKDESGTHRYATFSRRHGERLGGYYSFQEYRVTDVQTVAEFLAKYYKRDRYTGRGAEYAACLLASHTKSFEVDGYDIISHHDSNTGEVVAFYG